MKTFLKDVITFSKRKLKNNLHPFRKKFFVFMDNFTSSKIFCVLCSIHKHNKINSWYTFLDKK